ncbi:MAG: thiamine-monophosphate kinase [Pedosphaera sp.]|nr:thiamine-monophosphate kinase [Pedosphaera sp.]
MNEFDLIARLAGALPADPSVIAGIGDDCAVLDVGLPDRWLLFKTDAVVEGVHFTTNAKPEQVGHKALARALSDIAAMAGTPTHALITLALPSKYDVGFVEEIYRGLNSLAARHAVAIVGGETTTNPDRMLLSIALLGWVAKDKCVRRSGAKVGDALFVTGELGGSLAGRHLEFEPRLAEARWLARNFSIHSMMDLSDGVAGDLRHILKAGGVGAELLTTTVPVSRAAKARARQGNAAKSPLLAALTDGEDFELLLTIASADAVRLLDAWKQEFPALKLSCIGKITSGSGITLRDHHGARPLNVQGYTHFA